MGTLWGLVLFGAVLSANFWNRMVMALADPSASNELYANVSLPQTLFVTNTTTTTFLAGQLTGSFNHVYANTQGTPGSIATRTAAQMFSDCNAQVGMTYMLTVVNAQGTGTLTMTAGTGVTITGTATVAVNTSRRFVVTFNTATTCTLQNVDAPAFS